MGGIKGGKGARKGWHKGWHKGWYKGCRKGQTKGAQSVHKGHDKGYKVRAKGIKNPGNKILIGISSSTVRPFWCIQHGDHLLSEDVREIKKLKQNKEEGILDTDEFKARKAVILEEGEKNYRRAQELKRGADEFEEVTPIGAAAGTNSGATAGVALPASAMASAFKTPSLGKSVKPHHGDAGAAASAGKTEAKPLVPKYPVADYLVEIEVTKFDYANDIFEGTIKSDGDRKITSTLSDTVSVIREHYEKGSLDSVVSELCRPAFLAMLSACSLKQEGVCVLLGIPASAQASVSKISNGVQPKGFNFSQSNKQNSNIIKLATLITLCPPGRLAELLVYNGKSAKDIFDAGGFTKASAAHKLFAEAGSELVTPDSLLEAFNNPSASKMATFRRPNWEMPKEVENMLVEAIAAGMLTNPENQLHLAYGVIKRDNGHHKCLLIGKDEWIKRGLDYGLGNLKRRKSGDLPAIKALYWKRMETEEPGFEAKMRGEQP